MKKYLLLITLALIVVPLVTAGCTSPSNPSPSPSAAASTATSSATAAASTTPAASVAASASPTAAATASPTAAATASQQTYTVSIVNFAFQPSTMTIPRGASVTWTNAGSTTHTVTAGAFSSGNLSPGATFTHQFPQAGTYSYHCSIHPSMTGTITVQ